MPDSNSEHFLLVKRVIQFMNLTTVYKDYMSGHYIPTSQSDWDSDLDKADSRITTEMGTTLMFLLYAFFYSLVDSDRNGLNAFRIWRIRHPEQENAIVALEVLVSPILPALRTFRNKVGFHGSRSHVDEGAGLEFFSHPPLKMWNTISLFVKLHAALLALDMAKADSSKSLEEAQHIVNRVASECRETQQL